MITFSASASYGYSGQYIARITGRHPKFMFDRQFVGRKGGKRNEDSSADVDEPGLYEECDVDKRGKSSTFYVVGRGPNDSSDTLRKLVADKADAMVIAKAMDDGRTIEDIVRITPFDPEAKATAARRKALDGLVISYPCQADLDREYTIPAEPAIPGFEAGAVARRGDIQEPLKAEVARLDALLAEMEAAGHRPKSTYTIVSAKEAEKAAAGQTLASAIDGCWAILQSLPEKEAKKVLVDLRKRLSPKEEPTVTA